MRAGIGILEEVPENTFVTNISGINSFHLCRLKYHNDRNLKRVRPIESAHFLDTGTLGHDAVEDLHTTMGEWDSDAALGIAHKHAEEMRQVVRASSHMTEKGQEERLKFADWLIHALPHYAQKYRGVPWQKVFCVEEPMWILLDREELPFYGDWGPSDFLSQHSYSHVLIVGRPDAVVQIRDKVWHCQRKFFSSQVDLLKFVKRGPFQKHEVGYQKMFEQLSLQGEFDGLPVGNTLFDLLRKLEVPTHPSAIERPIGCKLCEMVRLIDEKAPENDRYAAVLAHHKKADHDWCVDHIGKAMDMVIRYHRRVEEAEAGWNNWVDRAFLRHESIVGRKQRDRIWNDMLYDIGQMMAVREGRLRATASEGWACNAYFSECPYVGVCAGRETLDGPQFVDSEDDYAS